MYVRYFHERKDYTEALSQDKIKRNAKKKVVLYVYVVYVDQLIPEHIGRCRWIRTRPLVNAYLTGKKKPFSPEDYFRFHPFALLHSAPVKQACQSSSVIERKQNSFRQPFEM